jgi:rubrerythrin
MARSSMHGNGRHKSHNGNRSRSNGMHKSGGSRSRRGASINPQWLKDFLSEMLAVEKGGVKLYERALSDLQHSEHEDKLNEFLRQTERHVELCTDMLQAAGGDSEYMSPGAQAAEHKAEGLISTEVPPQMMDLNNIENLVLAETKDQWNWETLDSISSKIEDDELKRMAIKAVREVRKQEKSHLDWNEQTLTRLAMESSTHAPAEKSRMDDGRELAESED